MTALASERYRERLGRYSDKLLDTLGQRSLKAATPTQKRLPVIDRLVALLGSAKQLKKIAAGLLENERRAIAILRRAPLVSWRWDHVIELLTLAGVKSPYPVLQSLLAEGLATLEPARTGETVTRFEVAADMPPAGLPRVAIAPQLVGADIDLPTPPVPAIAAETPMNLRWRRADGWEIPIRLGIVWRLAWLAPFKRTQQQVLFKRDLDRLRESPLLSAGMLDGPVRVVEPGILAFEFALSRAILTQADEESDAAGPLADRWSGNLDDVLLALVADYLELEGWSELAESPAGQSAGYAARGVRFFLLEWLARLEGNQVATIRALADLTFSEFFTWLLPTSSVGPLRSPEARQQLALEFTEQALLGPLFQLGMVEVATQGEETFVRLAPRGRRFLGEEVPLESNPAIAGTLLAQPNHQLIVYRQGLSLRLLSQLMAFAEPKTLGAALTFELNPESVYHGLEAGLSDDEIIRILTEHGGRELPPSLAESIRTWSRKRERLSIYADVSLFEFADGRDRQEAMDRGLDGVPLGERLLLIAEDQPDKLALLRITASRDYRLPTEPCVSIDADGITLRVDLARSDLMLETEIARFADLIEVAERGGGRVYRVTAESIGRATQQGLRLSELEDWYLRRTGSPPPPSAQLLFRAAIGLSVRAESMVILSTDSPTIAEGLLQHPTTRPLLGPRLGPAALTVPRNQQEPLREALGALGIDVHWQEDIRAE